MTAQAPEASLVGKLLDERYELLEIIGRGGVGVVYRARRVNLERMVAVKVLHAALVEEAGFVGRFEREAAAMSRLYHPHCVAVIDSGVYESRPYLVLEYLPGHTITKLLEHGPFEPQRAAHVALQLLETLEYFHGHHVIHRDLKSENVMLVESSGTTDFVKVLDFGMAKILTGPGADSQLSKIGFVPGTPSVMAPEQIYQLPPDPRIDIYATGILMYEMVVGQRPFRGTDAATVVKMQIGSPPKPPREVLGASALSEEFELVIIKALEKDRIDRFGTAGEMAAALRRTPEASALVPGLAAPPVPVAASRPRRKRSRRTLFAIAGVALALALAAGAAVQLSAMRSAPHAQAATKPRATARPAIIPAPVPAPSVPPTLPPPPAPDPQQRIAALVEATAHGTTPELRHAALDELHALGEEARADLVAMRMLDVEQAETCSAMRDAFKELRASDDPRVWKLKSDLRARGRRDRHVRCLKRLLSH